MSEIIKQTPPTYGQLEEELSQKIDRLYREELAHSPSKIICKFFNGNLAIVIENSITTVDKFLLKENKIDIVKNVNLAINNITKSKLEILIEQVLAVKVYNILINSSLKTQHTSAIVILSQPPIVQPQKLLLNFPKASGKMSILIKVILTMLTRI